MWCISSSEENGYYGDWPTRTEAIANGVKEFGGDPFWVGKARPPKNLSEGVFADGLLESAQENLEDEWMVEWSDFSPTKEHVQELEAQVRAIVDAWVERNCLKPKWFLVDEAEKFQPVHLSD